MPRAELERRLEHFINERLLSANGERVGPDTLLFEDGYINSLRVLDLIAFLERTLGRKVPDRAVKLASFRSIRVIARTLIPDGADPGSSPSAAPACIAEHRTDRSRFASPVEMLRERGDLVTFGRSGLALGGVALDLVRYFDAVALRWARELGAVERRYPSLIALGTLERAGYVESFPAHLTVASHLDGDSDRLDRIAAEPRSLGRDDLAAPRYALAPAVCYHCYAEREGQTIDGEPVLLTALGRCFRHEGERLAPPERLWEFTMREVVVLGSREQVEEVRRSAVRKATELLAALELDGRIEPATDPFFTRGPNGRRLLQRLGALKYELSLALDGDGRPLAVASFNHHENYFGRRFDIRCGNGRAAHSGCVAFGLERWALAFLTQHGLDESAWPAEVRAWCETGVSCDQLA